MSRLRGPRLKVERANEHIAEFAREWESLQADDPYTIFRDDDPETGDLVYRVSVADWVPDRLNRMSLAIGDAIHNLRSALDLLAWQLVEAGDGKPGRWTYFPIADSWKEFEAKGPKHIKGASEDAVEMLYRVRPYKRRGHNALWRLHRLDIADKHRLLITVGSSHVSMQARWRHGEWESSIITLSPRDRQFPLVNNSEIYRVPAAYRQSAENQPEPKFTIEIAFGEGEVVKGEPVFLTLQQFVREVEKVLNLFEPILDPLWDMPF